METKLAIDCIREAKKLSLQSEIDDYIFLFGIESLEKLLNELFEERQIKPIKIKSKMKAPKLFGESPIKVKRIKH